MSATRILVVEDDPTICEILVFYLSKFSDYDTTVVGSAEIALTKANEIQPDIFLLDIMLPGIDGLELCRKLRKSTYSPIIFISAITDDETIVKALDLGGDDYITKPFNCEVLRAKIQSNLRRISFEKESRENQLLNFPFFKIDSETHEVRRIDGSTFLLSPIEYDILLALIHAEGKTLSEETIFQAVWHRPSYGDVRTIPVHIFSIRRKIEKNPGSPAYLKTSRGKGYYFDEKGSERA